jgi:glycosyltransferase involved in cell wall biosynthesis
MKVSLVITVFNEEKTIERLIRSLERQTRALDEIIFVDGGSKDKTVQLIKAEAKKNKKIKPFIKKGATIAQGRNLGLKKAKNEIIAMTDAGCIAHQDWLEKIIQPFKDPLVGIAAGFYQMTGKTAFQQAVAPYLGILPEELNPVSFLPSARSMAFRKNVWEKVGGFKEKLARAGEDTLFNYQAIKAGVKFVTVADALVDWEMPKTLGEAAKKFFTYAKGDAQAGIWWHPNQRFSTHNLKILAIYGRYWLGLLLLVAGFFQPIFWWLLGLSLIGYSLWAVVKNGRYLRNKKAFLWLPIFQIVSDLAVMAGFASGVVIK